MRSNKYGLGLAITAACMAFGASTASADRVEVLANDINDAGSGWYSSDTRANSSAKFGTGPAIPKLGTGSVQLATPASASKVQLFTDQFDGVKLSDVDGLGFSTYRFPPTAGASTVAQAAINIRVDKDGDGGGPDAYLVYEPYMQPGLGGGITPNTWLDWDAYKGGSGIWWSNQVAGFGQSTNKTWNDFLTAYPNAKIAEGTSCGPGNSVTPCAGSFGLNQGSGNEGALSNADALYISLKSTATSPGQTTFDFESEPGPTGPQGAQGTPGTAGGNGQPGATGVSGAFVPSSTTVTGKVSLISKSLKVSKRSRKVSVGVSCPRTNGLCEGRLNLIRRGKTIARTNFVVRGGRSGNASVTLSKKAYKALKKSQSVKVDVFSRDLAGNASSASKSLTLKK